jgi:hypothetical protein
MAKRLSRKQLYELVWSEPMKILAPRFGISDVALKKACARAEVPTLGLGHWAKKAARKSTSQVSLGERPPGMGDEVVGGLLAFGLERSREDYKVLAERAVSMGFAKGPSILEQEGSRFGFERRALRDGLVDANDQSGRAVQGLG